MDRLRATLLSLSVLAACGPPGLSSNEQLVAVDYWPEQQLLFLGAPRSGAIDVLRVPSSPRQGSLDFVARLTDSSRHEIVRIAVDRAQGRLWAADRRAIYVYPLRPSGPATRIPFGSQDHTPITDLVIDAEGNGYVFIAGGTRIYRISSVTLHPENWFETTYATIKATALPRGRAVVTKDGYQVIFQSPKDGSLLRLDLRSKQAVKIQRQAPISLDCAALVWNDGWVTDDGSIAALNCRHGSIGQIQLDADMKHSRERYRQP